MKKLNICNFLLVTALVFAAGASASGPQPTSASLEMAPLSDFPEWVQKTKPQAREAYQFALANPEILKRIPCYCGCDEAGHKSNYDCYVKEVRADGSLEFDRHGSF
jgi:hypothetical protein